MLELKVQQVYIDAITNGTKTIEGRLAKDKYLKLRQGDRVKFFNNAGTQSVAKKVVAIHRYSTFEAAFTEQDYKKAVPNAKDISDAASVYEQFYPKALQAKLGIVFIELEEAQQSAA